MRKTPITRLFIVITAFVCVFAPVAAPFGASAQSYANSSASQDFDPNFILPDEYVTDSPQLSASDIETFLVQRKSGLANRSFYTAEGWLKASEIIARSSQMHRISAQFILVKLQKEQSLVETANPTQKQLDWAAGFGVCDSCSMSDPAIAGYKGFGNQVAYAGAQMRKYLDNPEKYRYKPGATASIDGMLVTFSNRVTAALYNYTPHLQGNKNLWKIWQRYWFRPFTDGMVLLSYNNGDREQPVYWLLRDGARHKFASKGVYVSYGNSSIAKTPREVPQSELERYPLGAEIRFPEYSLIRGPGGSIYLLRGGKRSAFDGPESFRIAGFNPEEVEDVTSDDLDAIPLGKMITKKDLYPTGIVAREIETSKLYYVEQDTKYLVPSKEIFDALYPKRNVVKLSKKQLATFVAGEDKFYPAGTVVKSSDKKNSSVYLVGEKGLQPFRSNVDFVQLGYAQKDVKTVDAKIIKKFSVLAPVSVGADIAVPTDDAISLAQ